MKNFIFMAFVLLAFIGNAFGQASSVADVKNQLISSLAKDGYLSKEVASAAAQKYITAEDKITAIQQLNTKKETNPTESSWSDYLSWINFIKVVGVIFFLVAFSGVISKLVSGMWVFIKAVPVVYYQAVFIALTLLGIFFPRLIWESQYYYIALFASFANIMVVGWIIDSSPALQQLITKLLKLGIPVQCAAALYGMLYFGTLAFAYHSTIFGFFAVVCLSSGISFSMVCIPGKFFFHYKENTLIKVILGHLLVFGAHIATFKEYGQYTELFNAGIQYYCTIILGISLLVGASPFYKRKSAIGYGVLFITLFGLASYGYFFTEFKVISSITFIFFTIFVMEWIGYISYLSGIIFGSAFVGSTLYALSLLLEKYGSLIILKLP